MVAGVAGFGSAADRIHLVVGESDKKILRQI